MSGFSAFFHGFCVYTTHINGTETERAQLFKQKGFHVSLSASPPAGWGWETHAEPAGASPLGSSTFGFHSPRRLTVPLLLLLIDSFIAAGVVERKNLLNASIIFGKRPAQAFPGVVVSRPLTALQLCNVT